MQEGGTFTMFSTCGLLPKEPHLLQGTRHHEGLIAGGKVSNQAGMNFLNELSWQGVDISLVDLGFLTIPEQLKLYQHLVQQGTRQQQGRGQRGRRKVTVCSFVVSSLRM